MNSNSFASMWELQAELGVRFKLKNSEGIFQVNNGDVLEFGSQGEKSRRLVVVDQAICHWYLDDLTGYFRDNKVDCRIIRIPSSEEDKALEGLLHLLKEMESFGLLRRSEPVIAVGGGALLDLVGMAASLYRRGVPYIKVPTTLVGMIDAGVGIKTGINFEGRRNRLGTYYPPIAVYIDKSFLKTLPNIEISSGLGEILKMAVVKDQRLFEVLESDGKQLLSSKFLDCKSADEVINRAVVGMKEELETNLWETNLKRLVDFGHSFSPIIEMRSIDTKTNKNTDIVRLTHGQAVALDVQYSCIISETRGLMSAADVRRVFKTARSMGLPTNHQLFRDPVIVLEALNDTMKHRNGAQNLPIPVKIGESIFLQDLGYQEIKSASKRLVEINCELFES